MITLRAHKSIVVIYLVVSLSNWPYLLQLAGYDLFFVRDILPQTQTIVNFLAVLAFSIINKSLRIATDNKKIILSVLLILAILLLNAINKNNKSELFLIFYYFSYIPVIILFSSIAANHTNYEQDLNKGFLTAFYCSIIFSLVIKFSLQSKSQYIAGTSWGFGNFSNLLALTSVFILPKVVSLLKEKRYWILLLYFLPILASAGIIFINGTRAALIILLVGVIYTLRAVISHKLSKFSLAIVFLAGIVTLVFAYNKKRESNEGRILVYKVCLLEYTNTGILFKGIGYNKFQADYPAKVIDYSEKKGIEKELEDNMANTFYAFNDYLQLFIEVGVLGGIIILLVGLVTLKKIYSSYRIKWDGSGLLKFYLAAFFLLALIHYPFRVFEISKLFILTTIIVAARSNVFNNNKIKNVFGRFIFMIFLTLVIAVNGLYIYNCFKVDSIDIVLNFRETESKFKKAAVLLNDNVNFLRKNAAFYEFHGQNKKAIETYNKIMRESLTAEYYHKVGTLYFRDSFYVEAENNFTKATQLIPKSIKFQLSLFEIQVKLKKCDFAKNTLTRIEELIQNEPNLKAKKLIVNKINFIKKKPCFE